MADVHIACPACAWEPDGQPHWMCDCGHVWDTFDTAGRCPACRKQWEHTACIAHAGGCDKTSLHLDWYHGLTEWVIEQLETVEVAVPID